MTTPWLDPGVARFLEESNQIEGILEYPTWPEIQAAEEFLGLRNVSFAALLRLQAAIAPGRSIRDKPGMNVRVGPHVPPSGGPLIATYLRAILDGIDAEEPWRTHVHFEWLHPFMDGNGRTGRLLWAWHMRTQGVDPFGLPFLHRFYYQTLTYTGAQAALS
jgi:hypothetical protein